MAKFIITKRDQKPIRLQSHVRDIRKRYERALQMGYSSDKAAEFANAGTKLVEPAAPAKVTPSKAGNGSVTAESIPHTRQDTVSVSGQAAPRQESSRDDIPPNWEDLPWPQIRELAARFSDKPVRSRSDAEQAIRDALA